MLNDELNQTQLEIKRWVDKLDQISIAKEAEWGIGNLLEFVSAETAGKVQKQNEKLAGAIQAQDIRLVQDLVNGFERAYKVMEEEARARGHKPIAPEYMEVKLDSGFHLRIAKNGSQARAVTDDGVFVWTLEEVARVVESDFTLVNQIKDVFPDAKVLGN